MKAVVIYSGGMDSYTTLHVAKSENEEVHAVSFNYGQRHKKELDCAKKVCEDNGIEHKVVDITSINELLQGSSLTSPDVAVPEGHYAADNMKQTVVPNRNMILISLAAGYAVSIGADMLYCGVHSGDHAVYADCRPEFIAAMQHALNKGNEHHITLSAPFLEGDKTTILKKGFAMGLDYVDTSTCYKGGEKACGVCGSCGERILAFHAINKKDPVEYEGGWEKALNNALALEDPGPTAA